MSPHDVGRPTHSESQAMNDDPPMSNLWIVVRNWVVPALVGTCLQVAAADDLTRPASFLRSPVDRTGDPLPEGARLRLGTVRFRPSATVADMALSPSGKILITAGEQMSGWDATSGRELWRRPIDGESSMRGPAYGIRVFAFSPDSTKFYTPGSGHCVLVWETETGKYSPLNIRGSDEQSPAADVAFASIDLTSDGQKMALGSAQGVCVCNLNGAVLYEVKNQPHERNPDTSDRLVPDGPYSAGRFAPDGTRLSVLTSDRPQQLRILHTEDGTPRGVLELSANLVRWDFSPDGKSIVTTERDNAVRMYNVATGQQVWSQVLQLRGLFENYTSAVAISPDGKVVAAGATDNRIYRFESRTGERLGELTGHSSYPWAVVFSADSRMLYSAGWDGRIRRWDLERSQQIDLPDVVMGTSVVAASNDGRTIAYADEMGSAWIVDVPTQEAVRQLSLPGTNYSQLVFSPDCRFLAAGGSDGDQVRVVVWRLSDGVLMHRWDWKKGRDSDSQVEALSFSPDGKRIAAAVFRQSQVYVWDVEAGDQIAALEHQSVYGLSFSPDGSTLATAGWDSRIRFWDPDKGELSREFDLTDGGKQNADLRMYAVCYSPDSEFVAAAHLDGSVRVWQAKNMLLRSQFQVTGRFVFGAMNFSSDGLWMAVGTASGQVELWEPSTGNKVRDVGRHQGYLYTVGFGRDIRTIVSGGEDGVAYLWEVPVSERREPPDMPRLWTELSGDDAAAAFRAWLTLETMPAQAIKMLEAKLRPVKTLLDLDFVPDGKSMDDIQRMKRLKKVLIDKDPKVESTIVFRRALSLLVQFDSADARQLVQQLAESDPSGDVGRYARTALARMRPHTAH